MTGTESVKLGSVAIIQNGKTPSIQEKQSSGHPVLKIKDVDDSGDFRGAFASFVDARFAKQFANKRILAGDILILNAAHNTDYVASKIVRVFGETVGAIATGEWMIVRADRSKLNSDFLFFWITSFRARTAIRRLVNGIHLYPKDVAELQIPLPPLDEQRRVATILDHANNLRRKRRLALDKLHELPQALFHEMFGNPNPSATSWPVDTLGSCITNLHGGANLEPQDFVDSGFPVLHKGAIKRAGLIATDPKKNVFVLPELASDLARCTVDKSFVAVTLRDLVPSGPTIGLVADLSGTTFPEYLLAQGVYAFKLDHRILPDYFVWLSNNESFRSELRRYCVGSTQIHMRVPVYTSLAIPIPPITVQRSFAERIARVKELFKRENEYLMAAEKLFASMQQTVLSGDLSDGLSLVPICTMA